MAPRRDNKQWDEACREAGIVADEVYAASKEFHAEKRASGDGRHWPYRKLVTWLRDWKEDRCRS